jgi:hypothetical protein
MNGLPVQDRSPPAELDMQLLFGLDGGLEAYRAPGERVGPGVYGDPE